MPIVIRPAHTADRAEITRLHIEIGASTYRGMMSDHYLDVVRPREKTQLWIDRMADGITTDKYTLLVAEHDDQLVGFIFFTLDHELEFGTYLHHLYISPSYQRQRLGHSLLIAGTAALPQDRQSLPVHLVALAANTRAIAFYEKLRGNVIEKTSRPQENGPDIGLVRYQWPSALELSQTARDRIKI
jgi:ribosomal protein S18 acetylase RimI-like enzyme